MDEFWGIKRRADNCSSRGAWDYCGVVSGGMELGPGFEPGPLGLGPKVGAPTGVVVLAAGWPTRPALPPPTVCMSESGS